MVIKLLTIVLSLHGASSFLGTGVLPERNVLTSIRSSEDDGGVGIIKETRRMSTLAFMQANERGIDREVVHNWTPQDLTQDIPGYPTIPDNDYVKLYQARPELWPVEFFVIGYRRVQGQPDENDSGNENDQTMKTETQILVRKSANGTSKWGLGTGVPSTRWMLSSSQPPKGYQWASPKVTLDADHFPEYRKNVNNNENDKPWTYQKINICKDAFTSPHAIASELKDPDLEEYARKISVQLGTRLDNDLAEHDDLDSWEAKRIAVVKSAINQSNCLAAIQGTFRMSGLHAHLLREKSALDPEQVVQSMRIYTMWPQMPDPMPLPSTPPEELQNEILSRNERMKKTGRNPHTDKYGRRFTHISTSNVSNTIHGVYFTLDLTGLPGLDDVPAFDLFGTKEIKREWKSLKDLKVLDSGGTSISTEDTKPTFISGFIVRQLVREGVIDILG